MRQAVQKFNRQFSQIFEFSLFPSALHGAAAVVIEHALPLERGAVHVAGIDLIVPGEGAYSAQGGKLLIDIAAVKIGPAAASFEERIPGEEAVLDLYGHARGCGRGWR